MAFENLKTSLAKLKYGELMIATAGALLLAVFSSLLAPETLKFLDTPETPPGFGYRVVLWSFSLIGAAIMLTDGFRIIGRKHVLEQEASIGVPATNLQNTSAHNATLYIQINHGGVNISISIQNNLEK